MKQNDSTKLMHLLQRLFQAQAMDAMSKTRLDLDVPDLTPWIAVTANAVKPLLLQLHQQGMIQAAARIAAKRGTMPVAPRPSDGGRDGMRTYTVGNEAAFGGRKGVMRDEAQIPNSRRIQIGTGAGCNVTKAGRADTPSVPNDADARPVEPEGSTVGSPAKSGSGPSMADDRRSSLVIKSRRRVVCKAKTPDMDFAFDLFNPRVLDAVDRAAFQFCRETMDTATGDLRTALDRLRQLMRDGLPRGDAIAALAVQVRRIFTDPRRAFTIAATEGSRAVHSGQMQAAGEAGVTKHSWLASSDACDRCLALNDVTVKLGDPFWVDPKGGVYASVRHPPLHPH